MSVDLALAAGIPLEEGAMKRLYFPAVGLLLATAGCHRPAADHKPGEVAVAVIASEDVDEPAHPGLPRLIWFLPAVVANAGIKMEKAGRAGARRRSRCPARWCPTRPYRTHLVTRGGPPGDGELPRRGARRQGAVLAQVRVPELGNCVRPSPPRRPRRRRLVRTPDASKRCRGPLDVRAIVPRRRRAGRGSRSRGALPRRAARGPGAGSSGSAFLLALWAPIAGTCCRAKRSSGNRSRRTGRSAASPTSTGSGSSGESSKGPRQLPVGAASEVELNAFPGKRFGGQVEYIGQQVDPAARTLVARLGLANDAGPTAHRALLHGPRREGQRHRRAAARRAARGSSMSLARRWCSSATPTEITSCMTWSSESVHRCGRNRLGAARR